VSKVVDCRLERGVALAVGRSVEANGAERHPGIVP
jgi:hypothetical protein